MAGQFSPTMRPVRAGAYFNFQAEPPQPALVNTSGVVALPIVHSWGPAGQLVTLNSFADFIKFYGQGGTTPPAYTPGYIAVREAFDGEGLPGRGGAGQVLAYRMVGSAGASATLALQNTTPATAVTLTAVYPGSYGNQISVAVVANALNPTTQVDVQIYVQGFLTETFTAVKTDIPGIVAAVNNGSAWVTATAGATGVAIALVSTPTALTAGADGATLVAGDWTAMMSAVGSSQFGYFAPYDLTDSSIIASIKTWGQSLNQAGHGSEFVTGGPLGETATGSPSATSRATALNDPDFATIGVGTYNDSLLGNLSTSQLAPRLAGIMAARGAQQGLSFARLARLSMVTAPTPSDILTGITNGFITLGMDSNPDAPVRIEKGVTSWTTTTDTTRPRSVFGNPKFVVTMHTIQTTITEWAESNVIGILPVDDDTVQYVLGWVKAYLGVLQTQNVLLPGWTVIRATNPVPTPTDDFIALSYTVQFTRDTEQVLSTVVVG